VLPAGASWPRGNLPERVRFRARPGWVTEQSSEPYDEVQRDPSQHDETKRGDHRTPGILQRRNEVRPALSKERPIRQRSPELMRENALLPRLALDHASVGLRQLGLARRGVAPGVSLGLGAATALGPVRPVEVASDGELQVLPVAPGGHRVSGAIDPLRIFHVPEWTCPARGRLCCQQRKRPRQRNEPKDPTHRLAHAVSHRGACHGAAVGPKGASLRRRTDLSSVPGSAASSRAAAAFYRDDTL
jgi:hypothetical protein